MKTIQITPQNNFIRIFELPETFSSDFCFGGTPCTFIQVDWFNTVPPTTLGAGVELDEQALKNLQHNISLFIMKKVYYKPHLRYIGITNYNDIFFIA